MRRLQLVGVLFIALAAVAAPAQEAKDILAATGVKGGLIVHVGCGDGRLTAALRTNDSFIVHGLDADATKLAKARQHIRSLGLYGKVSVAHFGGERLPYAENVVNLLVAEDLGDVPMSECLRVLAPRGVAYVKQGGKWAKTVTPWPDDIDEWTHFLHDASNNAVARDQRVGPPRRLQWTAGPAWCRSHEFISSFSAMVSAGGRVYYVIDLSPAGVTDQRLPESWTLISRDAFNGVLLWQRPLPKWRGGEWRSRAMRGRPASVPRRLVASGDRLFMTLSHDAALSELDGATGRILRTLKGTEGTQEIALTDGTLVLRLATSTLRTAPHGAIAAVDAETGQIRWQVRADRFQAQSLAAVNGRAIYSTQAETVCLSLADGKELWRAGDPAPAPKAKQDPKQKPKRRRRRESTLLLHGGLALETDGGRILAREAATGKTRWTAKTGGGSMRGHDFFVARGRAWHAASGGIAGYDLKTGKVIKTIDPSKVQSRGHHLRCYRSKATERFLITTFRGTEFISLTDDAHSQNDWTRGPCRYGLMPANGMLYAPPHQCFCYPGAMMSGLNAYATAPDAQLKAIAPRPGAARLLTGAAYGSSLDTRHSTLDTSADWPMYRHDARRTGATTAEVPAEVADAWETKLGGKLTPPVAAGGRVFVAAKEQHAIHALGADDGKKLWQFIADGPIDSPPSIHEGLVLFGCADGWVYCLRASDGVLAWRFRAAPMERLIVDESRVESAWRVHGSVLLLDGVAYCSAGRSSFLDGGVFLYGLDPKTGKVVHEGRLDTLMATREDARDKPFLTSFHIEGTRSDLLVAEGGYLYFGMMKLSPDLKRQATPYVPHARDDKEPSGLDVAGKPYVADNPYLKKGFAAAAALGVSRGHLGDHEVGLHLFSTGGFLDDSWWNRTFWMYARTWPGYQIAHIAPKAGQLVVVGPETTYAVQAYPSRNVHSPMFTPGDKGYLLVADRNDNEPLLDHRSWSRDKGMGFTRKAPPVWHQWVPIRMRSMVLAGGHLFVAGPPDRVKDGDPLAAFHGRTDAVLRAVSAVDGRTLSERRLPVPPVHDGLIAAGGRLYVSTIDGRVLCLAGRSK